MTVDPNRIMYLIILASFWLLVMVLMVAIFHSLRVRKYLMSTILTVGMIVWLGVGLLIGTTPGSDCLARYEESKELFGQRFWIGSPIMAYDSPRGFNGDGYSIEVLPMPDELVMFLSPPPANFTTNYPIKPVFRAYWEGVHWRPTPVSSGDSYLDFALEGGTGPAATLLNRLAHQPGSWYAYFHSSNGYLENIDYWLVCPKERVIVWVNHNT